jgi:hypothetical protein
MASRKPASRRGSDKTRKARSLQRLSRRAKTEVAQLLKRNEAGTITRMQLDMGLKEVDRQLKIVILHMFKL